MLEKNEKVQEDYQKGTWRAREVLNAEWGKGEQRTSPETLTYKRGLWYENFSFSWLGESCCSGRRVGSFLRGIFSLLRCRQIYEKVSNLLSKNPLASSPSSSRLRGLIPFPREVQPFFAAPCGKSSSDYEQAAQRSP